MEAVRAFCSLPDSQVRPLASISGKAIFSPTVSSNWVAGQHWRNDPRPNVMLSLPGRNSMLASRKGSWERNSGTLDLMLISVVPTGHFRGANMIKAGGTRISGIFLRHQWRHMGREPMLCHSKSRAEQEPQVDLQEEGKEPLRFGQLVCWVVAIVYVGWLFILPYAPGDPVWAITPSTIQLLIEQSLNFFYVLPLASMLANAAGYHGLSAPVQHPMAEALFNLVIGWTLLFGPLLFTDRRRDRFGWSLETLWIIQMFLTNTVLAPYMAIRQNKSAAKQSSEFAAPLKIVGKGLVSGAYYVGVVGALVGALSILWATLGRPDGGFGGVVTRWDYLLSYVRQERLAYAFVWDFVLYAGFQPWLIGDNLGNVRTERREVVRALRAVPYVGLVAYVLSLENPPDQSSSS